MAIYPATYIVRLTGPDDSPLERGGFDGQPLLRVWAYSEQEALKKARKDAPAGHRVVRAERQGI